MESLFESIYISSLVLKGNELNRENNLAFLLELHFTFCIINIGNQKYDTKYIDNYAVASRAPWLRCFIHRIIRES